MLADELEYVIGVDTHRDAHALAVVAAASGGVVLVEPSLAACPRGYRRALALARARAHAGGARAFASEGTGSYGAGLARFLAAQGERVLEVERPRRARAPRGKSDVLDAVRAARGLLGADKLAQPRAGGRRAALQALLRVREGALSARRAALCQLRARPAGAARGAPLADAGASASTLRGAAAGRNGRPARDAARAAPARPADPAARRRGAGADAGDQRARRAARAAAARGSGASLDPSEPGTAASATARV